MTEQARIRRQRHRDFAGLRRSRLDKTQERLALNGFPAGANVLQAVATFNNLTNQVTITGLDDLPTAQQVIFTNAGGALPAELEEGLDYFLADAGVNLYTLYPSAVDAAAGTNAIAFTDDGTGTTTANVLN